MKATLNLRRGFQDKDISIIRDKKMLIHGYYLIDHDTGNKVVDCRLYMSKSYSANTVYCLVWISHQDVYGSGYGKAGGYGYHKPSAAVAAALQNAGIQLSDDIHGRGDSAIVNALLAIAESLNITRSKVFEAYP